LLLAEQKKVMLVVFIILLSSLVVVAQDPDPFDETPPDFEAPAPATPLDTWQYVLLSSGVMYGMYRFRKSLRKHKPFLN
jgi:hypothetical protein